APPCHRPVRHRPGGHVHDLRPVSLSSLEPHLEDPDAAPRPFGDLRRGGEHLHAPRHSRLGGSGPLDRPGSGVGDRGRRDRPQVLPGPTAHRALARIADGDGLERPPVAPSVLVAAGLGGGGADRPGRRLLYRRRGLLRPQTTSTPSPHLRLPRALPCPRDRGGSIPFLGGGCFRHLIAHPSFRPSLWGWPDSTPTCNCCTSEYCGGTQGRTSSTRRSTRCSSHSTSSPHTIPSTWLTESSNGSANRSGRSSSAFPGWTTPDRSASTAASGWNSTRPWVLTRAACGSIPRST